MLIAGCRAEQIEPTPTLFLLPTADVQPTQTPIPIGEAVSTEAAEAPQVIDPATDPDTLSTTAPTQGTQPQQPQADAPQPAEEQPVDAGVEPDPISAGPAERVGDSARIVVELKRFADGAEAATGMTPAPNGRMYITEKAGRIRVMTLNGFVLDEPFMDITDRIKSDGAEQGLVGLAFHPNYQSNGYFYVHYTDLQGDNVIARYSAASGGNAGNPDSEEVLLRVDQPEATHNGGQLVFGPDGYLYIGIGDGGGGNDTFDNAQNGQTLMGSILRVDVNGAFPYSIPNTNPFVGDPNFRDEIWAYGLRNPWRFSFDRVTDELYIGDVGEVTWEEINVVMAGSRGGINFGWPIYEGLHCTGLNECDSTGLTMPITEHEHGAEGCAVIGGYVYRGVSYPVLRGTYLFSDFCSGFIWGLSRNDSGAWRVEKLGEAGFAVTAFGQDLAGEVYILDHVGGGVFQITGRSK